MKRLVLFTLMTVLFALNAVAQNSKYSIEGTVCVKGSGEPIPFAQVLLKEINQWGFTNDKGEFKIQGIFAGNYTFTVNALGYVDYTIPVKVTGNIPQLKVMMQEDNLALQEVTVTAKAGETMNSSSKINKQAIQHLQASNLSDVMQLIPGNLIKNPSLSSKQSIQIRSISSDNNNAFGVAYLVNGNRIQNDASMADRTALPTMDFRSVSAENIESIEVLKGVVSAEYGDMTSGAVIVKTKAGRTPLQIKVKADPYLKSVSADKGFSLGKNKGYLNIDADYANFNSKLISTLQIFDRFNFGVTYSNTFNQNRTPLRFNVRFSGSYMGNNAKSDPDLGLNDYSKSRKQDYNLSVYGVWTLNKKAISSLNYNFSVNYGIQNDREYKELAQSLLPTTNIKEDGIHVGTLTSGNVKQLRRYEDNPIYINAKITGHLNKKNGGTLFNTLYGIEWNTKGNEGKGTWYAGEAPQYFRERPNWETPYMHDFNAFIEEKVTVPMGSTSLQLSGGVRLTKAIYKDYDFNVLANPRFNAKYLIYKGKRGTFVKNFALKGGYGLLDKLPGMNLLYGGDQYYDIDLFRYNETNFSLIQTAVNPQINKDFDFKTTRTRNIEAGFEITLGSVEMNFTYFNEHLKNGLESAYTYMPMNVRRYKSIGYSGADPVYENNTLMIKDELGNYVEHTDYTDDTDFKMRSYLLNKYATNKSGLEYDINFGKIKAISTSINVIGAYIKTKGKTTGTSDQYSSGQKDPLNSSLSFPYIGVYEGAAKVSSGVLAERLNTNVNVVTNIPKLKMVMTFTLQCVWMDRTKSLFTPNTTTLTDGIYVKDPISYKDAFGNVRPFSDYYTTTDEDLKLRLSMLRLSDNYAYKYITNGYKPYFMANIRISKEIGKLAAISFYANNFTNSQPLMKNSARPNYAGERKNTDVYFGAELKITL